MQQQQQQPPSIHVQTQPTYQTPQTGQLVVQDQLQRTSLPVPQIIPSTFIEPPQYLTAISVASNNYPVATNIAHISQATEYLPANLVMTPAQNQIQDELQRKHEELQHLIVQQQEELRRVSEQLLMARYGLLPYGADDNSGQQQPPPQQQICDSTELVHLQPQQLGQQPGIEQVQLGQEMISYMQLTPVSTSHLLQPSTSHSLSQHSSPQHQRQQQQHHHQQQQQHQHQQQQLQQQHHQLDHQQLLMTANVDSQNLEVMPYHMVQPDQDQNLMYSSNLHSPSSTSSLHKGQ
jgi:circadian locomoter output cycles kaput protein